MSIGHSPDRAPYAPDMEKITNPTAEEKLEAQRRIEGSNVETVDEQKGRAAIRQDAQGQ